MREIIENNHDDHETAWTNHTYCINANNFLRDKSVETEQWNYFLAFKSHNKRMESF